MPSHSGASSSEPDGLAGEWGGWRPLLLALPLATSDGGIPLGILISPAPTLGFWCS